MKQASKRLFSFAVGVLMLFGALIIFFNLVQPAYQDAQALKAQKYSLDNFYQSEQATQKQVDAVVKAYSGSGSPQALADLALPPAKDEADVVNQLNILAAKYQLSIQNVSVSSPGAKTLSGRPVGNATTTSLVKPIGVLNIQLRVTGSYSSFKLFLAGLESNIRIMDITGLAIAPVGKSNQDYYTYDVGIASYYQNP